MSKATAEHAEAQSHAAEKAEIGPPMSGSEILIHCLEREGVEVVYGYSGGAAMPAAAPPIPPAPGSCERAPAGATRIAPARSAERIGRVLRATRAR